MKSAHVLLIDELKDRRTLTVSQYEDLLISQTDELSDYAAECARRVCESVYGKKVFIRGLIEFTNYCANDCLYCGIRRSNGRADRYRLSSDEILSCCREGYGLGFRTFVLQGGEDRFYDDDVLSSLIKDIKALYPDCAITLSIGERTNESYKRLYDAGADRYLLRHETADRAHYERLHPKVQTYVNRMKCLRELKDIGYQVGCGFMVGSPFQDVSCLASDLKFIEDFRPHMVGIGPFIPHRDTPFFDKPAGSVKQTLFLLSLIRLMLPEVLLPATTALGTLDVSGREKGILCGANVVMPNLSPIDKRKKYELYNNKKCTGNESAQCIGNLGERLSAIDRYIVADRGDHAGTSL